MLEIKTYSFIYNQINDRIQLIGNSKIADSRIDLWITRRMTHILIKLSNDVLGSTNPKTLHLSPDINQEIHSFEFQRSQQTIKSEAQTITLIDKEPTLIIKVDIKTLPNYFEWLFYDISDVPVAFGNLTRTQMHALNGLITDQAIKAEWGLTHAINKIEKDEKDKKIH
jgi:hypothetical protein